MNPNVIKKAENRLPFAPGIATPLNLKRLLHWDVDL